MDVLMIVILSGLLSILVALYLFLHVSRRESGSEKMREIAGAIREGAIAFMKRQYTALGVFTAAMTLILLIFLDRETALTYVIGSLCSASAGYFGMIVALKANVRTTNAALEGLEKAFPVAFYGGAVMGLSIVGLAVLGLGVLYRIFGDPNLILGFSLGASTISLFAKAGGGVYTKTADIGADLVGKVEVGIPEDDPRNPAVIADNVGDNVGDVAGMGADIFDSYVASLVSAMLLGAAYYGVSGAILPLLLAAMGVIAAIIGVFLVRVRRGEDPGKALNRGTYITCLLFSILAFAVIYLQGYDLNLFYSTIAGLVAGVVIGVTSDYFTSINRRPVQVIAESSQTGAAINLLTGFSYGLISIVPSIVGICAATIAAWFFAGLYGIAISAVGMLSITGMIVSSDAYGPIVDNAKGIAEQAGLEEEVVGSLDLLDAAGNTTKAITKGFAIGAAALTVLSLFASYAEIVGIERIDLMKPHVIVGAFIGAFIPPLFSAMLILGVGRNAFRMIEEVRRQFREIPGLMEGRARPDYARCVDIATKGALRELIPPSLLSIAITLIVGFVLGVEALGGYLAGSILTGIVFALYMANAGGAWDNAKKYIEEGYFGGKGSEAHKAAVVGDTVGDPFKDTAGPSLNTLLCVISLVASTFAPLILRYTLLR
ncbi:sodium-translocating pyrophosphatase [Candidatus Bathyarchaeota archaeon]|nr:MAG: sodium-translocating pyrophosphatase [Candidatus Bathyarchaeota archaeon]